MQINNALSSYANAALDTARSTMKGLADAAVPQKGAERADRVPAQPKPEPVKAETPEAPQPTRNQRQGVSLDAYA